MTNDQPKCYKCGSLSIEVIDVQKNNHKCLACKAERFYPEVH